MMTTLIATSVVRGSHQGESHGGVFLVDLAKQQVSQKISWDTTDIDWQGRGWDRGLRGIAFYDNIVYIVASDELFAYDQNFTLLSSYKNPYLKHCHEICIHQDSLFITSTGFDCIVAFDLYKRQFHWGMHIESNGYEFRARAFDPQKSGPMQLNKLHLNNVFCNENGMYISGLHSGGLLHFNGREINMSVTLPAGTHNARPYKNGVLFNDTGSDLVRFVSPDEENDRTFKVPAYDKETLAGQKVDTSGIARASFARGLCVLDEGIIAAGSSPSTIAIHDINQGITGAHIQLSNDVRHAIHGLEVWPY
jgi:hypothetical protein